jgi:hypothetical protein
MVDVTATDGIVSCVGKNLTERPVGALDNNQVDAAIGVRSGMLNAFIGALQNVPSRHVIGAFYSPYSCAEAHALAQYCAHLPNPNFNLSMLSFSAANQDNAIMQPCANCAAWLEPIGNTGRFRIIPARYIAAVVPVAPTPGSTVDFPALTAPTTSSGSGKK